MDHVWEDWVSNPSLNKSLARRMDHDHWFWLAACSGMDCGNSTTRTTLYFSFFLTTITFNQVSQTVLCKCLFYLHVFLFILWFIFWLFKVFTWFKNKNITKEKKMHTPRSFPPMPHSFCPPTSTYTQVNIFIVSGISF